MTEPDDLWTGRLPARYKTLAPHIVRDPETGIDTWRIGDHQTFLPVGFTAVAGWHEPFPAAPCTSEAQHKGLLENAAKLDKVAPPDVAPPVPVG